MTSHMTSQMTSHIARDDTAVTDVGLLTAVVAIAQQTGQRLHETFNPTARPDTRADVLDAVRRNEQFSLPGLREALTAARPGAGWVEEDQETDELGPGEWWAVDAVEGNVNHIHGMAEWGVAITLLREDVPVLAVVHQPATALTYTASRGGGALVNGRRLHVSAKTDLGAAVVATGQAEAGQRGTYRRIGESITAMLGRALVVRAMVPSTFPLLLVAGGQHDVFWQYQPVLPGVAAGLLLATEAGASASRIDGSPWRPGSPDLLVSAPGVHRAAVDVLTSIGVRP